MRRTPGGGYEAMGVVRADCTHIALNFIHLALPLGNDIGSLLPHWVLKVRIMNPNLTLSAEAHAFAIQDSKNDTLNPDGKGAGESRSSSY
jgi:hypothetical protein